MLGNSSDAIRGAAECMRLKKVASRGATAVTSAAPVDETNPTATGSNSSKVPVIATSRVTADEAELSY